MTTATYKRAARAHIAILQDKVSSAEARAELAEKQVRDLTADNRRLQRRLTEIEAALQSLRGAQ